MTALFLFPTFALSTMPSQTWRLLSAWYGMAGHGFALTNLANSKRLCARRVNREVRELHEPLQQLPIHDPECREVSAPLTGSQVQALGRKLQIHSSPSYLKTFR